VAEESRVAVVAAFAGNAALMILKGVAAAATGSAAMLAETFHSAADTGNQALLFLGMRLARRPPDARHPFGHGRDVYFWAFVVAMMLFTIGGALSIWESVQRLLHPVEHEASTTWAFGVLAGGFAFEAGSFAVAYRSLAKVRRGRSLAEYWRDSRDPTIITVLFEDTAALLSLGLATTGLLLSRLTGQFMWDALASLVIGMVLLVVAVILALENYSLLLGEAAPVRVEREVRRLIEADPAVSALRSLRTMALGPHEFLIAVEAVFARGLAVAEVETAVRRLERAIINALHGGTRRALVVIEPASPARGNERRAA
jgi:cation diffusion facilitator family transporter